MLHKLIEYADRHGIHGETGFSFKRIRWLLNFTPEGKYLGLIELNQAGAKPGVGKEFVKVPHLKFTGDTPMRQFLVDTTHYALLYGEDKPNDKLLLKHKYFLRLLHNAGDADPFLAKVAESLAEERTRIAICRELENQTPKAKPSDNVTFAEIGPHGSRIIVEEDAWHGWWRKHFPTLYKQRKSDSPVRCLISGSISEPCRTHPKIKGLGGDVGGKEETTLIGFNLDSFCSYGLKQSSNAAVDAEIAEQYAAALNELISRHSRKLVGTKLVHWYAGKQEVPDELDPLFWLHEEPDEEAAERDAQARARSLLDSIRTGNRTDLFGYQYYCLTLSGSSARVMVRDWIEGQFDELVTNIDKWFDDLAIVQRDGRGLAPKSKFFSVLGGLVRDMNDMPAPMVAKMWRVAVRGEPIPEFALAQALARIKVDIIKDEPIRLAGIGLLKAYHIRKGDINMQPYLNEDHPHPAYHCGRLMAVYADLQRAALGDVGAGVVERYYAAASATPALILGRLSRGSQFHLSKLEGGLANWYEQRLAGIWARIQDKLPKTLTLEEQSLFAMGYYQQKASRKKDDMKKDEMNSSEKGEQK